MEVEERSNGERLLTFEVAGAVYALPINSVLEVAEADRLRCVPSLPGGCGGVMNWHGDALPVVTPKLVLSSEEGDPLLGEGLESVVSSEHVLVVSDPTGQWARLGVPIDRVLGLVEAKDTPGRGRGLVIERRPVDGRVVSVLDPGQLVARAIEVIERAVALTGRYQRERGYEASSDRG